MKAMYESSIKSLPLVARGKVRDIYALEDDKLLMIATDRISAFDVVMSEPIPMKGIVLTAVSSFWFKTLKTIAPNHLTEIDPRSVVKPLEILQVENRAVVVKRLKPIMLEAVVRGYLSGSAWREYKSHGTVGSVWMPMSLEQGEILSEPVFTPASKVIGGSHDENITYAEMESRIGQELSAKIKELSINLYMGAANLAKEYGLMIADTKFEFGLDNDNNLVLMDELLTPDSSRFWTIESYSPGANPNSFDKQFLRDWLERELIDGKLWNKAAPPPTLPPHIVEEISKRYRQLALYLGLKF